MREIVFLDRLSLPIAIGRPNFPNRWVEFDATAYAEIESRLRHADVAITNKVALDAATLACLPNLKLIAVAATGVNHIDLAAAHAAAITVSNIRGYAAASVPEHALTLMLALSRNLPAYQGDVASGAWSRSRTFCHFGAPIQNLNGRTLTVIGNGELGRRTAKLAEAFGMHIVIAEHKGAAYTRAGHMPFKAALTTADIVSLHCPLSGATRNLLGREELSWLKPTALVVNTARGGLIDEPALLQALQQGRLGGAALDVLEQEPPSHDNPLLAAKLPNLIVTPHVAWASKQAMTQLADQLIDNIEAWAAGTPRNLV